MGLDEFNLLTDFIVSSGVSFVRRTGAADQWGEDQGFQGGE